MTRRRARIPAALLLTALAAAGCGDGNGQEQATGQETTGQEAAVEDVARSGAQRVALPGLFAIMLDLRGDMERVSRGIWTEAYDTIAAGAQAIADHPKVPPEELTAVSEALGPDVNRFKALDTRVHDLSVELVEAARARDMETVLARDAAIRQGCVECHTAFREPLRSRID